MKRERVKLKLKLKLKKAKTCQFVGQKKVPITDKLKKRKENLTIKKKQKINKIVKLLRIRNYELVNSFSGLLNEELAKNAES